MWVFIDFPPISTIIYGNTGLKVRFHAPISPNKSTRNYTATTTEQSED